MTQHPFPLYPNWCRCAGCGLYVLWPSPSPAPRLDEYPAAVRAGYAGPPTTQTGGWRGWLNRAALRAQCGYPPTLEGVSRHLVAPYAWLRAHAWPLLPPWSQTAAGPPRLLDVGCGDGRYLAAARQMGWQTLGVEFDTQIARLGQSHALETVTALATALPLAAESCEAVTFWHVIEHLAEPVIALQEARRLLKSGGWLGLETPNFASASARLFGRGWFHLDAPRHRVGFTPHSLRRALLAAGFEPAAIHLRHLPNGPAWRSSLIQRGWSGLLPERIWWALSLPLALLGLGDCLSVWAQVCDES